VTLSQLVTALQLSIRASLSAALSLAIAQLLQLETPLFAMVSAVIVTDLSATQTQQLALRRLAATVLGATTGAVLSSILPAGPLAVGVSILVAMLLSHLLGLEVAARVTGFVCGIVVLAYGDNPWFHALDRTLETVLGIGVAFLVSLVPKLIGVQEPERPDG
jgi:uncharacterized membrane protein YgaE (UPF0421/DUF939 family)